MLNSHNMLQTLLPLINIVLYMNMHNLARKAMDLSILIAIVMDNNELHNSTKYRDIALRTICTKLFGLYYVRIAWSPTDLWMPLPLSGFR